MQLLFLAIAPAGLVYFLFRKRRFDFYSIAYLSALVYFLPGFFGYALMPPSALNATRVPAPLLPETYGVFLLVLLSIWFGSMFYDGLSPRTARVIQIPGPEWALRLLVGLALLGLGITLVTAGAALFSPHKPVVMAALGRWRILWVAGASLGVILAFLQRRWWIFGLCFSLLLFDFYVGFRSNLALTCIALFVVILHRKGPQRFLWQNKLLGLFGVAAAGLFFLFKFLYIPIKKGNFELVLERATSPSYFLTTVARSEPFGTQAILNEALRERLQMDLAGLGELVYQLMLFAPHFGIETQATSDQFREALFPSAPSGLGSNIWAEMWCRGGWGLLVLFAIFFVVVLGFGSYLLRLKDHQLLAGIALTMSYWAFYTHRNSLAFQVNLEKRIVIPWLLAMGFALVVNALSRPRPAEVPDG
ncbi:MAG: hypothetical protein K0U98_02080 [Deltaproteobacteria bacterium]|nr:hypothetical protein [Deltaproteobacteria bacterium]